MRRGCSMKLGNAVQRAMGGAKSESQGSPAIRPRLISVRRSDNMHIGGQPHLLCIQFARNHSQLNIATCTRLHIAADVILSPTPPTQGQSIRCHIPPPLPNRWSWVHQ